MNQRPADHEITSAFIETMEASGVKPVEPISHELLSGQLVRFQVDGDRAGRRNGWARLFLDGRPAGVFGCHKRQISEKWTLEAPPQTYTPAQKRAYAEAMAAKPTTVLPAPHGRTIVPLPPSAVPPR